MKNPYAKDNQCDFCADTGVVVFIFAGNNGERIERPCFVCKDDLINVEEQRAPRNN